MLSSLRVIREYVEDRTGLNLTHKNRAKEYRFARAVYYGLAKKYTKESLQAIGTEVGRESHATVDNALKNALREALEYSQYEIIFNEFDAVDMRAYDKLFVQYEKTNIKLKAESASLKDLRLRYNKLLRESLLEPHEHRYRALDDEKREIFENRVEVILTSLERL